MIEIQLISVLLGLLTGLVLALTGAGGSILAIPLLVFGLHLNITQAAPIALIAVMSAASIGAIQGFKKGILRYKTAVLIATFGITFAPLGVWLATRTPTHYLSLFFAIVLIYVAASMWKQDNDKLNCSENNVAPPCEINPATSQLFWTAFCTKRLVLTGAVAGILSGLLGVGGGFVIVPSLRKVSNFDPQTIIATSLAVITLVSAGSVATYLIQGDIKWKVAVPFGVSTIISMFVFRHISHKISDKISQRSFAVLAVIAAILMIMKSN